MLLSRLKDNHHQEQETHQQLQILLQKSRRPSKILSRTLSLGQSQSDSKTL